MGILKAFLFLSLDGYYKDARGTTQWHHHGADEGLFSEEQLKSGNALVFGRTTYDMMSAFWPTDAAGEMFPAVARGMNAAEKFVVRSDRSKPTWRNTSVVSLDDLLNLKKTKNLTVLGSGSLVRTLISKSWLDELELMIDPLLLGEGTTLLADLQLSAQMELRSCRKFGSGKILLRYSFK